MKWGTLAIAVFAAVAVLALANIAWCGWGTEETEVGPAPKLGTDAPEIALKQLDGKDVKLSSFETKKPVLVIFWAAWCADSTRAIKEINKEYEAYKKSGVEVLTVAIDKDAKAITNFTKIQKIALPVVQDADKKLQAGYGITMVPATYIVDTKGKVAVYHKDYPGNRKLLEEIKALK